MEIIKIISEHKGVKKNSLQYGYKRVEAIVREFGILRTRHIDIKE